MKIVTTMLRILLPALAASLAVSFLIFPEKAMIAFFAHQLAYPSIIYINALFWVYPLIILRKGILKQIPKVNLLTFLVPCFIIILLWIIYYTGFLSDSSVLTGTVIVSFFPWEEVTFPTSRGIGNLFNGNRQLATIEGTNSVSKLTNYKTKLIPSSFNMEGDPSGSKKHPLPDSPDEQSDINKHPRLASTSPVLGSNLVAISGAQSGLGNSSTSNANPTLPSLGANRTLPALGANRALPVSASNRTLIASAENVRLPPMRSEGDQASHTQLPPMSFTPQEDAIYWRAPYNWDMERVIKGKVLTNNAKLTELLNILQLNGNLHLKSSLLNKDQVLLLNYLRFNSTGVELTIRVFANGRVTNDLFELTKEAKTVSDKYLNKLNSTSIVSYFANPLFRELRFLEKAHYTMFEYSGLRYLNTIFATDATRGYVVDVLQKDVRTASASPLNVRNNLLTKSVIENRINQLKEQLNLKE